MVSHRAAAAAAVVIPLHPPRERRLAEAYVAPLADGVSAIFFDDPRPAGSRARLGAELDGRPLGRRTLSTTLPLRDGRRRHVLLAGLPAPVAVASRVTLSLDGIPAAAIDPEWLESPLAEVVALTEGVTDEGRRRLLTLLVTTGASLFGADAAAGFAAMVENLLDLLGFPPIAPATWCPVGSGGRLITYRAGGETDATRIGAIAALAGGRIARLAGCALLSEGPLLHLYVPHSLPAAVTLVGTGDAPVRLAGPDAGARPRPLTPWLAQRSPATRLWVAGLLDALGDDMVAEAQRRELALADAAAPRLVVRHFSSTPVGLLYALDLEDPHGLVSDVRIERGGEGADLALTPSARPVRNLEGFLPLAGGGDRVRFRLIHGSGRIRTVWEGRVTPFRGGVPGAFDTRDPAVVAALAEARLTIARPRRIAEVRGFGLPGGAPALSIVAPVSGNLDIIAARAAMLFAEPGAREVEILCTVEAGRLADAAETTIADAAAVFGISHRLVVVETGGDAADRLLAGLDAAAGGLLLLLGAEVLPAAPGWLATWRCRLVDGRPLLGGTLVDAAGAVLDAGGRDAADRRYVGLPEPDLPDLPTLGTMRATAECVGMTRAVAEAIAASATRYPNPDLMIAEAVARLREDGREAATLLRSRFVRFAEPAVDPRSECVDLEAMRWILKRSFSPCGQKVRT